MVSVVCGGGGGGREGGRAGEIESWRVCEMKEKGKREGKERGRGKE